MRGLGKWASAIAQSSRPKARGNKSHGKSLLPAKGESSTPRESAVIHHTQSSLLDFGDRIKMDDNDLAVESTVETRTVVEGDNSTSQQTKETKSVGGISSL